MCCGTWLVISGLLRAGSALAIFGAVWVGIFNLFGLAYMFKQDVWSR